MRRRAALGLGLATALAAILLLFRGSAGDPEVPTPSGESSGTRGRLPETSRPTESTRPPRAIDPAAGGPARPDHPSTVDPPPARPEARLRGHVYTADGRPAVGATLTLVGPGPAGGKPPGTVAGEDGRFEFPVHAPGKGWRLAAAHPPTGQSAELGLDLPEIESIPEVDVHLEERPALEGRVLAPSGAPVEGASVRLVRLAPLELGAWSPDSPAGVATTDADGRYRLPDLTPGPARLVVQAEGFPARWIDLAIEADRARMLDVDLAAGTSIAGTVTGPDGRPVAGAVVRLVRAKTAPDDPGEERHARTGGAGRWRIEGVDPERWYAVEIWHADFATPWAPEEAVPGTIGTLDARFE